MKKMAVWGAAFMGLMMMVLPVMAAAAPKDAGIKLGVIDTAKLMRESKAAKKAQAIFLKDLEAKRGILAAKEKEVRQLEEGLKKPETKLSDEARREKTDRLAKEVKELKRLGSDTEEELKKKDAGLTQILIGEIREIVKAFSKKENYTLILERSAVVAADDAIDITDKIILIYDGKEK
ncbi:MAG: OmpH family outer membrane protein [Syntrophales bacterium]|nr:OmpH family outer membrane protein [Syntrophales bacterium]